jgi:glycosyltransferase involved in cell wall biosynthesis
METTLDQTPLVSSPVWLRSLHPAVGRAPSIAILSTYPPTQCGLATFASALYRGLKDVGVNRVGVIQMNDGVVYSLGTEVVGQWTSGSVQSRVDAARIINSFDVLLVQHEFGIFPGNDGSDVLQLLRDVHVPVLMTMHTVPLMPTQGQRNVFEALLRRTDAAVAMTEVAHQRCLSVFDVEPDKVVTIPHGATVPERTCLPASTDVSLLTWGLLGPGKGIEWVIDALAMLPELRDRVRYTVAGETHPKIKANDGEQYREMLKRRAELLGVSQQITFDDAYRSLPSLLSLINESTCVVLPYDSDDQITSGVLVDAVSAGRPVIATRFPHAVELLSDGAGLVVPHRDSVSLAHAIKQVAIDEELLKKMAAATWPLAAEHRWPAIAAKYVDLAVQVLISEGVTR